MVYSEKTSIKLFSSTSLKVEFSYGFFRTVVAFINSHGQLCVSFKEQEIGKEVKYVLSAQGFANFGMHSPWC